MSKIPYRMSRIDPQVMELWQSNRSLIVKNGEEIKKLRDVIWDIRRTMAALAERFEDQ